MKLKKQKLEYLDSGITEVFHFLELKASHTRLIGSSNIRNILYNNDYDLNEDLDVATNAYDRIYQEFLHIFNLAYQDKDLIIMDFKNGLIGDEPIRWSYKDMKKGSKNGKSFIDCLKMDDNKIKLDMCYIYNGIFTDINCLYTIHEVNRKSDLKMTKLVKTDDSLTLLKEDIDELIDEEEYFKALKRYFSKSVIQGKIDDSLLKMLNSDYGMFYKVISFLKLVLEVSEQTFKPVRSRALSQGPDLGLTVPIDLIKSNLEFIKQFASHVTAFNIDSVLNEINKIVLIKTIKGIQKGLERLIDDSEKILNAQIKKVMDIYIK